MFGMGRIPRGMVMIIPSAILAVTVSVLAVSGISALQAPDVCGNPSFTVTPIPDGRDFALSIIDDTDLSEGPDVEPVYDILIENGILTTRAVWVRPQIRPNEFSVAREKDGSIVYSGATTEDPAYLGLAKKLQANGFEIVLHGVSAGNDTREDIIAGYAEFKTLFGSYPVMDILHSRNIENLYAGNHKLDSPGLRLLERVLHGSDYQGHVEGSEYFWGDIARRHVKYVRLPLHAIKELNLLKINPGMPFYDPARPYVSYWFPNSDGSSYEDFMSLTNPDNLSRLKDERGVTIIYSHFAYGFTRRDGDAFVVREPFRERMELIGGYDAYFAPASEILDRLLAMQKLSVCSGDSYHRFINLGSEPVVGVTILTEPGRSLYSTEGISITANDEGELVLPDLAPHDELILFDSEIGTFLSVSALHGEPISRFERLRVELSNYFGALTDEM